MIKMYTHIFREEPNFVDKKRGKFKSKQRIIVLILLKLFNFEKCSNTNFLDRDLFYIKGISLF